MKSRKRGHKTILSRRQSFPGLLDSSQPSWTSGSLQQVTAPAELLCGRKRPVGPRLLPDADSKPPAQQEAASHITQRTVPGRYRVRRRENTLYQRRRNEPTPSSCLRRLNRLLVSKNCWGRSEAELRLRGSYGDEGQTQVFWGGSQTTTKVLEGETWTLVFWCSSTQSSYPNTAAWKVCEMTRLDSCAKINETSLWLWAEQ